MNVLNKKYHIELEVLTPLHVGAGQEKDWMKGSDYVKDAGKIYVLNQREVAKKLSVEELTGFLVNKDDRGLKKKLAGALPEVSDMVFDAPANSDNDIKVFIKNGLNHKPFVPGSSVKGALRSILLDYFITDKNNIDRRDKRFEEKFLGSANKGDEFMRFIKISDGSFEKTSLVNTKIFNLYKDGNELKGGWKHKFKADQGERATTEDFSPTGFNTIYEVLEQGETGTIQLMLSETAFNNLLENKRDLTYRDIDKKSEILHNDITTLFEIINTHTRNYIEKQIAFFNKYSNKETDDIIESLNLVLDSIPDDNSGCVLKMSAGSGFHSITGDWQFDDFSIDGILNGRVNRGQQNGLDSAKSRKIAIDSNGFHLMGFVKLSVLSDEEIARREQERIMKAKAIRKAEAERIAKEKAEKERIEAEKREREEAARKAEEERIAKEKAEKEEREALLKQKAEKERQQQEANKQKREKLAQEGLAILNDIDDFNKGKNIIKEYKKINKTIPPEQYSYIKEFIKRCIPKGKPADWKNIKRGNWKDVRGWVGQDNMQEWFNEMIKK